MALQHPVEAYHYRTRDSVGDPWSAYAEWREHCPVAHTPAEGGYWILTRYDDIVAAARDTQTFSSEGGVTVPRKQTPAPLLPFEVDPPRHVKLRALVTRYFTNRALESMPAIADAVCDELAAPFASIDRAELMGSFALPLACRLFATQIGLPTEHHARTIEWLRPWVTPPYDAAALGAGLAAYDALLAEVEAPAIDDATLTDEERHGLRFTLLLAGIETTLYAFGNAVVLLDGEPDVRRALLDDDRLLPAFVEEALRIAGPAEGHTRTLTRDIELNGQQLRAGEHVLLVWASGSRDESRFPAGARVDLAASSTSHLAFGFGAHRCVGAPLARIEMQAAFRALLRHAPAFRVDHDAIDWYPNSRGPMRLPIVTGN